MDVVVLALAKKAIANAIEGVTEWERVVVSELPSEGEAGVVYLVLGDDNVYDEYVWIDGNYRQIGTQYDITNTTTDVDYIMEGE